MQLSFKTVFYDHRPAAHPRKEYGPCIALVKQILLGLITTGVIGTAIHLGLAKFFKNANPHGYSSSKLLAISVSTGIGCGLLPGIAVGMYFASAFDKIYQSSYHYDRKK